MNSTVREAMFRLLGVAALLGSSACGGNAANASDASAGGEDGTAGDDSSSMNHGTSDANLGDTGQADAASDARTNLDADAGVVAEVGAACVTDSVTFRMLVAPTSPAGFCSYFSTPITATWIGVRPAEGTGIAIADPCPTVSACASCYCNGGFGYGFLGEAGVETNWNGAYYVSDAGECGRCGMCGQCVTQGCAPPGSYVATFCAYPQASDGGCDTSKTVCVDTPFTWPPADGGTTVVGVLGH